MTFGNNIMFSAVVHVTIVTAVLALAGRGAVLRAPEEYVIVTLIEHAETLPQRMFEERISGAAKKRGALVKSAPRREPAAVPPQARERKESAPATPNENKGPSQYGQGSAKVDQAGMEVSIQGGEGFRITSAGTDDPAAGKETAAGSSPRAISAIKEAIERAKIYPALARRRNQEGAVEAEFSINAKGMPENVRIIRSSGFSLLDSAAQETIVRAAPFPVISGRIEVRISFVLK